MLLTTPQTHPRIALSDDGETLAVDAGTVVKVWHRGAEHAVPCARHQGPLALAPDGTRLFLGADTVSAVDVASGQGVWKKKTGNGADPVTFSADGGAVFFREVGKELHRVDLAVGADVARSIRVVRDGYFGTIMGLGLSRSGAVLGTVVQRRREWDLVRWSAETLEPIDVRTVPWAVVSGRGGRAVVKAEAGYTWVDLDDPSETGTFGGVQDILEPLRQVLVDPTGRYVGFLDGLPIDPWLPVSVWDMVEDREVVRLDDEAAGQVVALGPGGTSAIAQAGDEVRRIDL